MGEGAFNAGEESKVKTKIIVLVLQNVFSKMMVCGTYTVRIYL